MLFRFLIFFLVLGILFNFAFWVFAQQPLEAPKTLEEAKKTGEGILSNFPQALKNVWQQALNLWKKMLNYVLPWLKTIWSKISWFLNKAVEKKKPEIKEKFEKEKEEMKEEIPAVSKSLWQKLKELVE